jgi:hypothetical protein
MGRNFLQIFGPSFVKCYTFHIAKQQLIILSRTVQSKDCTTVSRMRFVHAPLRRLGPKSFLCTPQPPCTAKGRHWSFPGGGRFGTPIVLPNEFLQGDKFSVDSIVKKLKKKLWMFLLFLCPGTIQVPNFRLSCQMSCCAPPSSGGIAAASSRLSTAPMMAPTPSCSVDPVPSSSGSGRRMRSSPSAASRSTRKQTPHLEVRDAVTDCRASAQAVLLPPSRSHFQTCWFLHLLLLRCLQVTVQEPFFRLQTGFLHALNRRSHPCLHSSTTRTLSGHRHRDWASDLSSCRVTPELRGSPVETGLRPWLTVKPVGLVL